MTSPSATRAGLRVLVVDDNDRFREGMQRALRRRPEVAAVLGARGGAEALATMHAERPDVVLMDHRMPDLTGLEVLRAVAGDPEIAGIPVVLTSAETDDQARREAIAAGAAGWVDKLTPRAGICAALVCAASASG